MKKNRNSNPPMGFEQFCSAAWPDRFADPFTREDVGERASVRDLQTAARAVMTGGLHAVVLERGKGKTTLACALAIWVAHEGLRSFPVLLCRDKAAAEAAAIQVDSMMERVHAKWRRDVPDVWVGWIGVNLAGMTRPGVRDKVERPDFALIDDPLPDDAEDGTFERTVTALTTTVPMMAGPGKVTSALLLGNIGLCRALQARGWAGT